MLHFGVKNPFVWFRNASCRFFEEEMASYFMIFLINERTELDVLVLNLYGKTLSDFCRR